MISRKNHKCWRREEWGEGGVGGGRSGGREEWRGRADGRREGRWREVTHMSLRLTPLGGLDSCPSHIKTGQPNQ